MPALALGSLACPSPPCLRSPRRLTRRSNGPPSACHPGRAAHRSIMRRTARAPCRRRPFSSTLGPKARYAPDRHAAASCRASLWPLATCPAFRSRGAPALLPSAGVSPLGTLPAPHCLGTSVVRPSRHATPPLRPNWSFNRSANGWPPCPRGARCLCCTPWARRPPAVARVTLR